MPRTMKKPTSKRTRPSAPPPAPATPAPGAPEVKIYMHRKLSWISEQPMPWDGWEAIDAESDDEGDDGIAVEHQLKAEARLEYETLSLAFERWYVRMWRDVEMPRRDEKPLETARLFFDRAQWSQFVALVNRMDADLKPLLEGPPVE